MSYIKLTTALKHLVGEHNQLTHAPKSGSYRIRDRDIIGNKILHPDPKDVEDVKRYMDRVGRFVNLGDVEVVIGAPIGHLLGKVAQTLNDKPRRKVIVVNPKNIHELVSGKLRQRLGDPAVAAWFGNIPVTYDSILEHTTTHEAAHYYAKEVMPKDLASSWAEFHRKHYPLMSGYGQMYDDPNESFADAFSNYVTGIDLPGPVEDWFNDNLPSK